MAAWPPVLSLTKCRPFPGYKPRFPPLQTRLPNGFRKHLGAGGGGVWLTWVEWAGF